MISRPEQWCCTLIRRVTYIELDGGRGCVDLWHNFITPFPPFKGLRIEYTHMNFDQGSYGDTFVKEFSSDPIRTVSWDCKSERFVCYENDVHVEKCFFEQTVQNFIEQRGWFCKDLSRFTFDFNSDEYDTIEMIHERNFFTEQQWVKPKKN